MCVGFRDLLQGPGRVQGERLAEDQKAKALEASGYLQNCGHQIKE